MMRKASGTVTTRNAATYQRVSTDRQEEEGVSLDAQERSNLEFAIRNGYTVNPEHLYRETGSGGDLWQRQEFMRLLAAAKRGEFEAVVCYCVDRLTRELFHLGYIRTVLEQYRVELLFVTEDYDDSLESDLLLSVRGVFGREERRKISARVRDAYTELVEKGVVPGQGPAAYGYLRANGSLIPFEPEATVLRRIFAWAVEGLSANAIVRRLNAEGVPPPTRGAKRYGIRDPQKTCGLWGVATVVKLLRNPVYRGELQVRRVRSIKTERRHGKKGNKVPLPREEWRSIRVPALVSESDWYAAQQTLSSRRGVSWTRNCETSEHRTAHPALLRGLIYCADCGCALHPDWAKDGTGKYRCSSRCKPTGRCGAGLVNAAEVEEWAWDATAAFLQDPALVRLEVERRGASEPDPDLVAELEREEKSKVEVEQGQARLIALLAGPGGEQLPIDIVQQRLKEAEQEKVLRADRIAALKARLQSQEIARERLLSLSQYCQRVARNLTRFDWADKRLAMEALGIRVTAAGRPRPNGRQRLPRPPMPEWRVDVNLAPEVLDGIPSMPVIRPPSRPCWRGGGAGV